MTNVILCLSNSPLFTYRYTYEAECACKESDRETGVRQRSRGDYKRREKKQSGQSSRDRQGGGGKSPIELGEKNGESQSSTNDEKRGKK